MANPELEKLNTLEAIIRMALNSYFAAARSRDDLLDDACGAPWEPRAQEFIAQAAVLQPSAMASTKSSNTSTN